MKQSSGPIIRSVRDISCLYTGELLVETSDVYSYKTLTSYISEIRAS